MLNKQCQIDDSYYEGTENMRYSSWLIADILLLAVCLVLLFVDAVIIQDTVLALVALGGVFIFSIRVGRDVRRRSPS